MRSTGIVRKLDELGRIVIPIELRRTMCIEDKDALEIYTDGEKIVLQKYQPGCCLCGEWQDEMVARGGKMICPKCIKHLTKQAKLDQIMSKR